MGLGGGFASGFAQGQSIFKNINQQYQDGEQKRAMAEIADAKPETASEFTADQGAEMEKLAGQGYKIDFDPAAKSYVAKNEAGDSKVFGMQQYTDLMGQRTAGAMSQSQIDNAKMLKMADVIGKSDPMASLRMKKEVRDGDYQAKRQAREEKAWAKEDSIDTIDKDLGAQLEKGLVGPDGQRRTPTADDFLAQNQQRIAKLQQAGFSKEAGVAFKDYHAAAYSKLELESKEREAAATKVIGQIESGDLNAFGDYANRFLPTGSKVTGVAQGKDGAITVSRTGLDGRELPPLNVGDLSALKNSVLGSVSTKMAYDISGRVFSQDMERARLELAKSGDARDERRLNESIRHNRAQEGIAATRAASRSSGNGTGAAGGFDPLAGFDEKQAQKVAADTVAKQLGELGGSKLTPQEYAKKVNETYFSLRDEYANGAGKRHRQDAFTADAKRAKTPEEIESVRLSARERGFSDEEMAHLDPRFTAKKQATTAATSGQTTTSRSQASQVLRSPESAQADPVLDSAAGKQLDAAKQEVQAAQLELRAFGLRQRQQSPAGYEAAQQRLQAAKSAESQAQSQWQAQIERGAMGAYFGNGKR